MSAEPFSFEKKDFVITTEKDNAKAREWQMKKLQEALESRLSDNFKNFKPYTSKHWYQARKKGAPKGVYRDSAWIGFYERGIYHWQKKEKWKRDVPQFQVSLNDKGLHILVDIDHSSCQAREAVREVIKKHKDECFDILKKLGNDWSVRVKSNNKSKKFKAIPLPDHKKMVWSISQLKLEDMDVIINYLTYRSGELDVEKNFTKSEARSMKTSIVDELSNGFEKLHPLYTFLTEQNSPKSQILSGKYLMLRNLDKKFEEWLKRGAKKAGKSIEDYTRDLGKDEYEARYKTYSKLKVVLEKEPIDMVELSTVSKVTTCIGAGSTVFGDHYTNDLLTRFLEDERAKSAVKVLTQYKNETHVHLFSKIVNDVMPAVREAAGDSERRVGMDPAQILLIASVFLTALQPDKFVDYRKNRWGSLAKQIGIEEEFATATNCALTALPEEIGKFAKQITETPTFKKYWPDQEHPLWTLAGICWAVKDSNVTRVNRTPMDLDRLVTDILDMNGYNLAIDKDVVKRIIRHLDAGKDVVLVGAPGVGKTVLAKKILEIVGNEIIGKKDYHEAVANGEWTRRNVIGGLNLTNEFESGCVTIAAEKNQWLLIDEFNRADINKAFGEMFLGIESKLIKLSEEEENARVQENKTEDIEIPKDFKMVCTMNDFDKNLLLTELSYGLITRFAFVHIIPNYDEELDSIKEQILKLEKVSKADYEECDNEIKKFYEFIKEVRKNRMIGVRTCLDVIRYTVFASVEDKNKKECFLDEALCDYLLPQFDRLDKLMILSTIKLSKKHLPKATVFIERLEETYTQLRKATLWMSDESEEENTSVLSENLESDSDEKQKDYSRNPEQAVTTMKWYRDNPGDPKSIEWAKEHHDDAYGYSKVIREWNEEKERKEKQDE